MKKIMSGDDEGLEGYMIPAVSYVGDLVDGLNTVWQAGEMMMPLGTGLSLNYPAVKPEKILGVTFIENIDVYSELQTYAIDEETGILWIMLTSDL